MKPNFVIRFAGVLACAGALHVSAASAATEKVVYAFKGGRDGAEPLAGLINLNGTLYGTTAGGGTGTCPNGYYRPHCGTVFSVNPETGAETVVYSFKGGRDGAYPQAGLISVGDTLYGTTSYGGDTTACPGSKINHTPPGCGTVFSLNVTTAKETVLHSFQGGRDGDGPYAGVIDVGGILFGTTEFDGANGGGTVFSINLSTRAEVVLHSFCSQPQQHDCSDGQSPEAGLINMNGTLYGTTYAGGGGTGCEDNFGCGTVFSVDPRTHKETVVYAFQGADNNGDGAWPEAGLISVNGTLYGTTYYGGNAGSVFSVNPTTGAEKVLYSFCTGGYPCDDGANPVAGLVNVKGTLYGTTISGGAIPHYEYGTVFSINPTTDAETLVHSFCNQTNCADGASPAASLINVKGTLYGTTEGGGKYGVGTVFSITP